MASLAFSGLFLLLLGGPCNGRVFDFEEVGGIRDKDDLNVTWHNGRLVNQTFALLEPGDEFIFPEGTFHLMGGIIGNNLESVTIRIEGTIAYKDDLDSWPTYGDGKSVMQCMYFGNATNLTITSSTQGKIDGKGDRWWGIPGIGYLIREENRPKLLEIESGKGIRIFNLLLKNSPYWTLWVHDVDGLEVGWVDIDARRTKADAHTLIDLTAFNTDGIDVTGKNVWVHDCNIWNQDDCIAVKDNSQNMLFERINASGLGLVIGSISASVVRNITFRDCYLHHTFKGIYTKFRGGDKPGYIEDVLYENIVIDEPEQWGIWIGPAQQSDSKDLCAAHPCSLCWPILPFTECNAPKAGLYKNITLRNVTVINPGKSPGVILADPENPMQNVTFDGVVVKNPEKEPWGKSFYKCVGVEGIATGGTYPVPECFEDRN